jgi:hypothetical protein
MIMKKPEEKSRAGGIFILLINLVRSEISEITIRNIAVRTEIFPEKNDHKDLLLFTILDADNITPNENRKTTDSKKADKVVLFLKLNISGRNFEKNSIRSSILNSDLSLIRISSGFENPM